MRKISFVRSLLYKAYSGLAMPLGFLAITFVMTNNLPLLKIKSETILEPDYTPTSRTLGLKDNLVFQRFIFTKTYYVLNNQCSAKPELYSVLSKNPKLH